MRLSRCWVLPAACCFFWPVVSRSQLTQQQVEQAIYNALASAPISFNSGAVNTVPWLLPSFDDRTLGEYLMYTLGSVPAGDPTVVELLSRILAKPSGSGGATTNILEQLGYTGGRTLRGSFDDAARDLWQIKTNLLAVGLDRLSFYPHSGHYDLLTYDESVDNVLRTMQGEYASYLGDIRQAVDGQSTSFENVYWTLAAISTSLDSWRDQWQETFVEDDPTDTVEDAEETASDEITDEDADASESFEEIGLPTIGTDYSPEPDDPDISEDDLGLASVSTDADHNALLRLVPRSSSGIIPEMEVDFGRMAGLSSGLGSLADLIRWLSGVLFGLLLSIKGISMWQVVRTASLSASLGETPIVHLAYHPF